MEAFAALVVDKANAMLAAPPPSTDQLTFELLHSLETSGAMDFSAAGAMELLAHMMVDACNEEQLVLEGNPDIVVMTPEDSFPGLCLQDMAEELARCAREAAAPAPAPSGGDDPLELLEVVGGDGADADAAGVPALAPRRDAALEWWAAAAAATTPPACRRRAAARRGTRAVGGDGAADAAGVSALAPPRDAALEVGGRRRRRRPRRGLDADDDAGADGAPPPVPSAFRRRRRCRRRHRRRRSGAPLANSRSAQHASCPRPPPRLSRCRRRPAAAAGAACCRRPTAAPPTSPPNTAHGTGVTPTARPDEPAQLNRVERPSGQAVPPASTICPRARRRATWRPR